MAADDQGDTSGSSRHEILEDHKHVRALLGDLEEHLAKKIDEEDSWRSHLETCLADFHRRLQKHFVTEEEGKLYRELKERVPRLAQRLERVFGDHPAILERLEEISGGLKDGNSKIGMPQIIEETRGLIAQVAEHEAAENEVMMDAYWDDLGGEG